MSVTKYEPVDTDLKWVTPRELEVIMEHSGLSAADLDDPMSGENPAKTLAVIAWVVTLRTNPDITLDEAWDVPIALVDEPVDPTVANS